MAGLLSLLRKSAKEIQDKLEVLRIRIMEDIDKQNRDFSAEFECQFFPEDFSDSRSVNFTSRNPLKSSHPIYGWLKGTERTISFSIVLVQEIKNYNFTTTLARYTRTIDINYAVRWLRRLMYPTLKSGIIYPPPLLRLYVPNLGIGYDDNPDVLYVYMTGCDVTYEDLYPDGTPRIAVVETSFVESIMDEKMNYNFRSRFHDFIKVATKLPPLKGGGS